jgi:hypothetical protein
VFDELDNLANIAGTADMPNAVPAALAAEGTVVINAITAEQRATLAPLLITKEQADMKVGQQEGVNLMCNLIARRLIVSGVSSKDLRNLAHEFSRQKPVMDQFLDTLHMAAERMENERESSSTQHTTNAPAAGSANHKNNRKNNGKKLGYASAVVEGEATPVEAFASTGNKKPAQNLSNTSSGKPPKCTYCGKEWHVAINCYKRMKDAGVAKKIVASEAAASPAGQASMPQPEYPSEAVQGSASGNDQAGW